MALGKLPPEHSATTCQCHRLGLPATGLECRYDSSVNEEIDASNEGRIGAE